MVPTTENYTSIIEPISIGFQWGTRSNHPQFIRATDAQLDEPQTTTMTYMNNLYTLEFVQLTDPTHKGFIIPTVSQTQNHEDIVLTFTSGNTISTAPKHIIIVVPIIQIPTVLETEPAYFKSIGNATYQAGTNISIKDVIPTSPFAYYTICSKDINSTTQNTLVFFSMLGLQISNETMIRISTLFNEISLRDNYGIYLPPLDLVFSSVAFTIENIAKFTMNLKVTENMLTLPTTGATGATGTVTTKAGATGATGATGTVATNATGATSSGPTEDLSSLESYKCVVLDPETQIQHGKLNIDPRNGKLLSTVEADRKNLMTDVLGNKSQISPEVFTKYVSVALGLFFTITIIGIVLYFLVGVTMGTSVVGGAGYYQRMYTKISNVPAYLSIGILAGFIGFMVGMIIKYR
jgi:hypothetical protein